MDSFSLDSSNDFSYGLNLNDTSNGNLSNLMLSGHQNHPLNTNISSTLRSAGDSALGITAAKPPGMTISTVPHVYHYQPPPTTTHESNLLLSSLSQMRSDLASLRNEFKTFSRDVHTSFVEITNSIDKLRAASSNDVPTYLPELSPADYPLVTNWDENDKMDKARIPKNDDADAPNRALFFLQKADGTTVTNREADHIRSVAFSVWDDLRMKPNPIPGSNGQAPDKWGQVSHVANAYFQRCMAASFPYLQYCSKNWKTTAVGTLNYSGWHTSRGLKTSEASRGQSAAPSERESSVAVTPAKRGASPGPDSSPSDKRQRLDPKTDAKGKGKLVKFAASKLNQRMQALGPAAFSLGRPASFTPPSSDALTASSEADAITPPFAPPIQYPRLPSLSGLTPPSCSSSTPPSTSAALASSANTGNDSSASNGFDSAAPSIASNSSLPTPSNLPATVPPVIDPALTGDDNVTAVHPPAPPALPPSPLPSTAAPPATEDFPVSAPDNAGPLEYFSPLTASMLPPWDEAATHEELGDKADKGFRTKKKPSTFKEFVALQWQATDKKERGGVSLLLFERFFYELSSVQRAIYNDKYRLYRTAQK